MRALIQNFSCGVSTISDLLSLLETIEIMLDSFAICENCNIFVLKSVAIQ